MPSTPVYTYKQLISSDAPQLIELLKVFAEAFGEPDTYLGKVPSAGYLQRLLGKEDFIVLVARDHERVVGGLAAYVLEKFEQERREVYIYDLAVLQAHRGHGVATQLIEKLGTLAKDRGAYVIFVQADKGHTPAIKLYSSLGKREETYNFDIDIH